MSSVLPELARVGSIELKITATGFSVASVAIAARNAPVQELASLLHTRATVFSRWDPASRGGDRHLIARRRAGADAARQALGGQAVSSSCPTSASSGPPQAVRVGAGQGGPRETRAMRRPSAAVRCRCSGPAALPPPEHRDARTHHQADRAAGRGGPAAAERLGTLVPDCTGNRDFKSLAAGVRALGGPCAAAMRRRGRGGDPRPHDGAAGRHRGLARGRRAKLVAADSADEAVHRQPGHTRRSAWASGPSVRLATPISPRARQRPARHPAGGGAQGRGVRRRSDPGRSNPNAKATRRGRQALRGGATASPSADAEAGAFARCTPMPLREVAHRGLARIEAPRPPA